MSGRSIVVAAVFTCLSCGSDDRAVARADQIGGDSEPADDAAVPNSDATPESGGGVGGGGDASGGTGGAGGQAGADASDGSGGAGGSGGSCGGLSYTNPPTCQACFVSKCCAAGAACAPGTDCNAYLACWSKCSITDSACEQSCASVHGSGKSTYAALDGCIGSKCAEACNLRGVDDPCSEDADCQSGDCDAVHGWCKLANACQTDQDCASWHAQGSNQFGTANRCIAGDGGGKACFPSCMPSNDQCATWFPAATQALSCTAAGVCGP